MRKTRVFAALLCLMMIATAIPMMQASATETAATKTATDLLGAYKVVAKQDYDSFTIPSQARADDSKLSVVTTDDGVSALKFIGHDYSWAMSGDPYLQTAQVNMNESAVCYAVPGGVIGIRFKLEGTSKFKFDLRNVDQIRLELQNGGTLRMGSGPSVTMASSGWHEIVTFVGGTADAPTGDFWYRNNDGNFQYFGTASINANTNPSYLSLNVADGATLYLDAITTYEKLDDNLMGVVDNAALIKNVEFGKYYTKNTITASSGFYAPASGTAVIMNSGTAGYGLYKLYEGEGGWSVPVKQISSTGTNNGIKLRPLNYNTTYGYCLTMNQGSTNSPDGRVAINTQVVELTQEGLALRSGTRGGSNTDKGGFPSEMDEKNGWKWDNTLTTTNSLKPTGTGDANQSYSINYAFKNDGLALNMGDSGAVMVTLKLTQDGSTAYLALEDGANGSNREVGFKVSNAGVVMTGLTAYAYGEDGANGSRGAIMNSELAPFPMTTGNWYDIVLKNDFNRYTIYARPSGTGTFTKLVSGVYTGLSAVDSQKTLGIYSGWSTITTPTKIVKFDNSSNASQSEYKYQDGTLRQYKAADVADTNVWAVGKKPFGEESTLTIHEIVDGQLARNMSEVVFKNITTFKDSAISGITKDEILGQNTAILNDVQFDAEAKTLADEGKSNLLTSGKAITGAVTADGVTLSKNGEEVPFAWMTANNKGLEDDMAVEITYTTPSSASANSTLLIQGTVNQPNEGKHRLYVNTYSNGKMEGQDGKFYIENPRNIGTRTLLMVRDGDSLKYYTKVANGNYAYLGKAVPDSGDYAAAPILLKSNNSADTTGENVWKIHRVTRYVMNGVADANTLPAGAPAMRKYVDENFADLNEKNYTPAVASKVEEHKGSVVASNNQLVLTNPTHDGNDGSGNTALVANYAAIPVGGYADMQLKAQAHLNISCYDGTSYWLLHIGAYPSSSASNTTYYVGADGQVSLTSGITFVPNQWYDLRIVRDAEGDYTAYAKETGETTWIKLLENVTPKESSSPPCLQLASGRFISPFHSNNENTKQYVKNLNIYGPDMLSGNVMMVLDGNQSTFAPADGAKIKYGAKVVIAPDEVNDRTLIFAGYKGDQLLVAEPVTVPAGTSEVVETPETLTSNQIDNIKVFLWDDFDGMTSKTPMRSFAK